jgi:transposase-like protein
LDINPATLRNWIEADERAARPVGPHAADSADDAAELRQLRQENAELRRANEILKTASAFFAQAELDRRLK